ncbi:MAG: HD domain-containing protein [Deltaproteobacteria bacterium]|nr:HD domain-containing protein [Deltaproteobacteria bacterium]
MENNMALMVYGGKCEGIRPLYDNIDRGSCAVMYQKPGIEALQAVNYGETLPQKGMTPEDDDISFLGLVRDYYPDIVRAFLSGQGSLKNAVDHMHYPEVFSYLTRLWSSNELKGTISKAFGPYTLSAEEGILKRMTSEQTEELSLINENLKKMISAPSLRLQEFVRDGIIMLATFAEAREDNTGGHIFRIRELTREMCEGLGLPQSEIEDISFSSMMHDVGKIRIPEEILLKAGPLNDDEKRIMQGHCETGERMLGEKPTYRTAREIARSHHERWDGTGYPDGLKGDSIPLAARITAIADAFDALTHERSYKKTWPAGMAVREMKALSGRQFDPVIMEGFCRIQSGEINKGYMTREIAEDQMRQ